MLDAPQEQACGITQYRAVAGEGLTKGLALAQRIAQNAPLSNFAVMRALPRIADLSQSDGLFVESLMAVIAPGRRLADGATLNRLPVRSPGTISRLAWALSKTSG